MGHDIEQPVIRPDEPTSIHRKHHRQAGFGADPGVDDAKEYRIIGEFPHQCRQKIGRRLGIESGGVMHEIHDGDVGRFLEQYALDLPDIWTDRTEIREKYDQCNAILSVYFPFVFANASSLAKLVLLYQR